MPSLEGMRQPQNWYHYNGTTCQFVADTNWNKIISIEMFAADSALAIFRDDTEYFAGLWDGSGWTLHGMNNSPSETRPQSLWASDSDNVYGFLWSGWISAFTEETWSTVHSNGETRVTCMSGSGPGDILAFGVDGKGSHFNGTEWSEIDLCTSCDLADVSVNPTGLGYVVSQAGDIWKRTTR